MIFVTVGHQMPFDRLVETVDLWAGSKPAAEIFAQIGDTNYKPSHFDHISNLSSAEFDDQLQKADLIISHAGTGTIIKAMELGKPIFVMPRRAHLGETRNDHQVHTIENFQKMGYVKSFENEKQLNSLMTAQIKCIPRSVSQFASDDLIQAISAFIGNGSELN